MMRIEEQLNEDIDNSVCLFENLEERSLSLNKIRYKDYELSASNYTVTIIRLMFCYCVHKLCDLAKHSSINLECKDLCIHVTPLLNAK